MSKKTKLKKLFTAAVSTAMLATSVSAVSFTNITATAASTNDYGEALELSLYFYDGNMCGTGVTDAALTWRGDCHTYDATASLSSAQGLSSSSISAIKSANGGSDTVDVSGGYHDAGDHLKFSTTMGFSATSLAWSYYSYPQSYDETGATDHLKYILRNTCDYLMKVTYLDSSDNVIAFCSMVGDDGDHNVWSAPETQTMTRTTYWADSSNPQASAAGEMAAALASSSLAFKDSDPEYAAECLKYANALQKFAAQTKSDKNLGVGSYYPSSSNTDDIAWSELWCALANNDGTLPSSYTPTYKLSNSGCYNNSEYDYYMYTWDKVWNGYAALLTEVGYDTSTYLQEIKFELNQQGGLSTSSYNAAGWGASRYNCALQMLALHIADAENDSSYAEAAKYQMDYILGNNPLNMSFLIGYGTSWPTRIHHRAANTGTGNPSDNTSATYTLYGALIGGPDSSGNYDDNQNSYQFTEPALDYNGAFALAIAGIYARYGGTSTAADEVLANASEINSSFNFGGNSSSATTTTTTTATTTTTTTTTTASVEETTTTTAETVDNIITFTDTITAFDWNTVTFENHGTFTLADDNVRMVFTQYSIGDTVSTTMVYDSSETNITEITNISKSDTSVVYGDVNCDGEIGIDDVVAVTCYVTDSNKNPLSEQALANADVYDVGSGVNSLDALAIQKYLVKIIDTLPETN